MDLMHGFPVLTFSGFNVSLARWDATTDTVTFDWPEIEKAAAEKGGSLEGIAKILLAARDRPGGFV